MWGLEGGLQSGLCPGGLCGHRGGTGEKALCPHEGETPAAMDLTILEGNALDLTMLEAASFDVVLCLGPLYHLEHEAQRTRCLEQALRVLKPGGSAFFAFINNDMVFITERWSTTGFSGQWPV